ncbi:MAG TPA: archaetidylserine decarboxylase [Methylocella sp.]|nr:archaetidylserine decarboxylase [Methylocella sp.]
MTLRNIIAKLAAQENLNFWLTNLLIPRRLATRFMGWFSEIEHPFIRDFSIAIWRFFSDLDLSEAKKTHFKSLHDCFIRELKEGARPFDRDEAVVVSPCDAIVGANGAIDGIELMQIKGFSYTLHDLLVDKNIVDLYRGGRYVTLRLTSSMYHRFHAPHDCRAERVTYISGDAWNVNPAALKRIEKLFCKNERAIIQTRLLSSKAPITLVPVAAILVASIRLNFLDMPLDASYRGLDVFNCDVLFAKGDEMGWFQHGSTIIIFAPDDFTLCDNVREGNIIRAGERLMRIPTPTD